MRWWNPTRRIRCRVCEHGRPKALHVRAAIAWPVSELQHRVRLFMVPRPARLVSVGRKGGCEMSKFVGHCVVMGVKSQTESGWEADLSQCRALFRGGYVDARSEHLGRP